MIGQSIYSIYFGLLTTFNWNRFIWSIAGGGDEAKRLDPASFSLFRWMLAEDQKKEISRYLFMMRIVRFDYYAHEFKFSAMAISRKELCAPLKVLGSKRLHGYLQPAR